MKPERRKEANAVERLEADAARAAVRLGWRLPTSEEEVQAAEQTPAIESVRLPDALGNPKEVLERGRKLSGDETLTVALHSDEATESTLARAAREAGRLTPEVREAMRRDRDAAEKEQDRDRRGQDIR